MFKKGSDSYQIAFYRDINVDTDSVEIDWDNQCKLADSVYADNCNDWNSVNNMDSNFIIRIAGIS